MGDTAIYLAQTKPSYQSVGWACFLKALNEQDL
jgi:hypothetical protein